MLLPVGVFVSVGNEVWIINSMGESRNETFYFLYGCSLLGQEINDEFLSLYLISFY